jgi:hypothetical protein
MMEKNGAYANDVLANKTNQTRGLQKEHLAKRILQSATWSYLPTFYKEHCRLEEWPDAVNRALNM